MMIGMMSKINDKMDELSKKFEMLEVDAAKKSVILSNFEAEENKKHCRYQLMSFFTEEIGIQVEIEEFYFIGNNEPRDIVINFLSANHKRLLFQNVRNIAHLRNSHGKKYTFRDYMTTKQNELRKTGDRIAEVVSEREPVMREDVIMDRGEIYIGTDKYEKKVSAPDPTKVLQLPLRKLNEIMSTEVQRAHVYQEKGNTFTAYTVCTNSIQEVQDAYMKIRLNHPEARHIVAAWNIPAQQDYDNADGCDDDEHGIANVLVKCLKKNEISHRAVYIVRNCGERMYGRRAPAYLHVLEKSN